MFPEHSEDGYAEVTSIQSLFSPGRYLATLYYIAWSIKHDDGELNIDSRRPDLQELTLSNKQMNTEVSSLDILLNVLASNGNLQDIDKTFYPINLPYDDAHNQIKLSLDYQGFNLQKVWDILFDREKEAFVKCKDVDFERFDRYRYGREYLNLNPSNYEFITGDQVDGNTVETEELYNVSDLLVLSPIETFNQKTNTSFNYVLSLTGQKDYQDQDENILLQSRFLAANGKNGNPGDDSIVNIYEYGAGYLSIEKDKAFYLSEENDTVSIETKVEAEEAYRRAQKVLRLANSINVPFHELDWIIQSLNEGFDDRNYSHYFSLLTEDVLSGIGEFVRLRDKYGISADQFATFFGRVSVYHEEERNSFFERTFSNADGSLSLKLGETLNFASTDETQLSKNAILCKALNVNNEELLEIVNICFGASDAEISLGAKEAAQLYRMGFIPNMLGLSFSEAYFLWNQMSSDSIVGIISTPVPKPTYDQGIIDTDGIDEADSILITDFGGAISGRFAVNLLVKAESFRNAELNAIIDLDESNISVLEFKDFANKYRIDITGNKSDDIKATIYSDNGEECEISFSIENSSLIFNVVSNSLQPSTVCISDGLYGAVEESLIVNNLELFDVIRDTEYVLSWLDRNEIPIVHLPAYISPNYSLAATPEMYNFLSNLYHSIPEATKVLTPKVTTALHHGIAANYSSLNLKATQIPALINWIEKSTTDFTLRSFWKNTYDFFNPVSKGFNDLGSNVDLIKQCRILAQYTLIKQKWGLTEQDLEMFAQTEMLFFTRPAERSIPSPSLPFNLMLSRLKEWQKQLVVSMDEGMQYFSMVREASFGSIDPVEYLANIHGWSTELTKATCDLLFGQDQNPTSFDQVYMLERHMSLAIQLEVDGQTIDGLKKLAIDNSASMLNLGESLMAMHHNDSVLTALKEARRDAWVAYYIANSIPLSLTDKIVTPDDLYEYLLLDTQVTDAVKTSTIAEAISSLQFYIHRCIEGYDPGVYESSLEQFYSEDEFLYDWDTYNKRYATWAGKERLLYYAGNYIDPSLRYGKTELFLKLEQHLLQGKLNEVQVLKAVQKYLVDYDKLSHLKTISGFKAGDMVYFVGETEEYPHQYYWRRLNAGQLDGNGNPTAISWTEWKKIDAPIDDSATGISPFWQKDRLHLSWISEETRQTGSINGDSLNDITIEEHTVKFFNIWFLDEEGIWQSRRKFEKDSITDGMVLSDPIVGSVIKPNVIWKKFNANIVKITADESGHLMASCENGIAWKLNDDYQIYEVRAYCLDIVEGDTSNYYTALQGVESDNARFFYEDENAIAGICQVGNYLLFDLKINSDGGVYNALELKIHNGDTLSEIKDSETSYIKLDLSDDKTIDENTELDFTFFNNTDSSINSSGGSGYNVNQVLETSYAGKFNENITTYNDLDGIGNSVFKTLLIAPQISPSQLSNGAETFFNYSYQEELDTAFDENEDMFNCSYGLYVWELFFHITNLVGDRFLTEQCFEEAETWFKYIFSSSGYRDEDGELYTVNEAGKDAELDIRYWNVLPLQKDDNWNANRPVTSDPDMIAMNDPMHYKLAIFESTIQLLIDRGDVAYRMLERDTLTEAKMYYIQASQLLGPKPEIRINNSWQNPSLSDEVGEMKTEDQLNRSKSLKAAIAYDNGDFLPPINEELEKYWDTIELRLYNLRHGLTIDGQPLSLPLYATSVSPEAIQVAAVAGDGAGGNIGNQRDLISEYRYAVLIDKANSAVSSLMQFGSSLLTAIEKQEDEALNVLLQRQQNTILKATTNIQQNNLKSIEYSIESTTRAMADAEHRKAHYTNLSNNWMSAAETTNLTMRSTAAALNISASIPDSIAAISNTIPNVYGFSLGGSEYGAIPDAVVESLKLAATSTEQIANLVDISENYRRRREDWMLQRDIAEGEVIQLDAQLKSLEEQRIMAQKQVALAELEEEHAKAIYEFQTTKFTGQELYNWMVGRLSSLYYQLYDVALPMCLMCKAALIKETESENAATAFTIPTWNNLYQGLLAGEGLALELQKLDRIWVEENKRGLEARKTVSIDQILRNSNPSTSLASKIENLPEGKTFKLSGIELKLVRNEDEGSDLFGDVTFYVGLDLFELGLSSTYGMTDNKRRLKSVAISIPALIGPYQDVEATLRDNNGTTVTLSHGQNDAGMWMLDYNDVRFLPFERLDPSKSNATLKFSLFRVGEGQIQESLFKSLTDIIFHIDYNIF